MKKRIVLFLFVLLVLAPFALISRNVQADGQLPVNQPDAVTVSDMQVHVAASDPTPSAPAELVWMLAAFSGIALLGLYALQMIVSGMQEPANA